MNNVILNSVITCPGFAKGEEMPIDACQFFNMPLSTAGSVADYRTREEFVPHCSEAVARCSWNNGRWSDLCGKSY